MCVCVCVCVCARVCDCVQLVVFLECSQHKWTPLFAAAWGGHRDVVMYLLEDVLCDKEVTDVVSIMILAHSLFFILFLKLSTHCSSYLRVNRLFYWPLRKIATWLS